MIPRKRRDIERRLIIAFQGAPHAVHLRPSRAADTGGHAYAARRGKKHFTVDIHCHIHVPAADARLAELVSPDATRSNVDSNPLTVEINKIQQRTILPKLTDPEERIKDMDASGIDVQAVSSSPFHYNYGQPVEIAREICGMVNDQVAETVASHPDRFVGLGILPLQDEDASLAELDKCVNGRGFRGIEISTNVNGRDLTRAGIEKVFAKCEELGVLIFVHPIGTSFKDRMDDHYFRNTIGHPLESALCVGHLVFDGYLDKYPGLKICIAHGGGYIPAYWGRFDHPWALRGDCRVNIPGQGAVRIREAALFRHRGIHRGAAPPHDRGLGRRSRGHGHRLPLRHGRNRSRRPRGFGQESLRRRQGQDHGRQCGGAAGSRCERGLAGNMRRPAGTDNKPPL